MQFRIVLAAAALAAAVPLLSAQPIDWHSNESVAAAAAAQHPSLVRLEAQLSAARERAEVAGSWPNPMLMGGVQNQQVDLSNDEMMTMYMVGASQTIPRKSRLDALTRSAELGVRKLEIEAGSLREEIRRDALFAWYDLAAADSQVTATEQVAAAVDATVEAARFRYEVGTTIQADVIRAQLRRSEIEHQLLTFSGRRRVAASRLLAQLGLPVTTEVPRLHLAHATEALGIEAPPIVPDDHPALAVLAAEVEQREQSIRLAELIAKPDWTIEASYGLRTQQTDMFSVMARVELPIRKKSLIEPQIRAAAAERDAAARTVDVIRRKLQEDLGVAWMEHLEATKQLQFHEAVLMPQSKLAFESTLTAYQSGQGDFEAVLSAETSWLRLEMDYYDFLAKHIKAITDFEAIRRGARSGAMNGMSGSVIPSTRSAMSGPPTGMSPMR